MWRILCIQLAHEPLQRFLILLCRFFPANSLALAQLRHTAIIFHIFRFLSASSTDAKCEKHGRFLFCVCCFSHRPQNYTYNFRIFYRNQRLYFALRNASWKCVCSLLVCWIDFRCDIPCSLSTSLVVWFRQHCRFYSIFNHMNSHWTCCIRALHFNISSPFCAFSLHESNKWKLARNLLHAKCCNTISGFDSFYLLEISKCQRGIMDVKFEWRSCFKKTL